MTEKRFRNNGSMIFDNKKPMNTIEVVDLLNEQHETIQWLEKQLRIYSDGLRAEIRETKEVMEDWSECIDEKKQLKEENEKLKIQRKNTTKEFQKLLDFIRSKGLTLTEYEEFKNSGDV